MKRIILLLLVLILALTSCKNNEDETNIEHNHSYKEEVVKNPSCKEEGILKYTCLICQDTYEEPLATLNHEYVNGICTECGKEAKKSYLFELFGEDIDIYTSD